MRNAYHAAAAALLVMMFFLAGGAALHESAAVDEVSHIAAGLSYLQRLDLRVNPEHPPLAKVIAAIPLVIRGTHADYSSPAWTLGNEFFPAYLTQWVFGDAVLGRWNDWKPVLMAARVPMLLLTLLLGWFLYRYASHLGGPWGGLLCLTAFVTTPAFLAFGPLILTDVPVTLFTFIALWQTGEIWAVPSRRNARSFGLAFGAALLSKFTGLLIIPIIITLFVQTRFWPTAGEPHEKAQRKIWRRARWRSVFLGSVWAAMCVYVVYFILSWNQPDDVLNRVGSGPWAFLIRRPLMPIWLYCRGLLLVLISGSRPSYLFGKVLPHGVPYYFPIVFVLKSTLGFLLLLLLCAITGIIFRKHHARAIPDAFRPHWRVLMIGFFVFLSVCLLSRLDISVRHFMFPIVMLILMLAPLPRMIDAFPRRRMFQAATVVLALSCFVPILVAYPNFFPYINSLSFGRPVYYLLNDSNVSWNEGLPSVEGFAREQRLKEIELDWASLSDPALVVPEAKVWDCQAPTDHDAGQWVAVAAVSILENRNCGYLQQYPYRKLAGGTFYVFKLPAHIPSAGTPGGPPLPADHRLMWGLPFDLRTWAINVERHPERLAPELETVMQRFKNPQKGPN